MSENLDWGAYVRGTIGRYVTRYLAYTESHNQPTAADYDALETEYHTILGTMDYAYQGEQYAVVRHLMRTIDSYLEVRGHWSEYRARLEQAIRAAEAEGYPQDAIVFISHRATLLKNTGNLKAACLEYQQLLTIFEQLDQRGPMAIIYHQLGLLAQDTGDYAEAQALFQQSLDVHRELGNKQNEAIAIWSLGNIAYYQGKSAEARQWYEKALSVFQELGDKKSEAGILHQLGLSAEDTGGHAEAARFYQQSLAFSEELGNQIGFASTLHQLGMLAQKAGEYHEARHSYQGSLNIAEELGDKRIIAAALHQLARLAKDMGNYAEARRLYHQSLEINEELGNQVDAATTIGQLGNLAKISDDYVKAEKLYRQAITILQEINNVVHTRIWTHNLAILCINQARMDEARHLLERVVEIDEQVGLPNLEQDRRALEQVQKMAEVERLYKQTIALAEEVDDVEGMCVDMFNLALLYEDQGRLREAVSLLERVTEIDETTESSNSERHCRILKRVQEKLEAGRCGLADEQEH